MQWPTPRYFHKKLAKADLNLNRLPASNLLLLVLVVKKKGANFDFGKMIFTFTFTNYKLKLMKHKYSTSTSSGSIDVGRTVLTYNIQYTMTTRLDTGYWILDLDTNCILILYTVSVYCILVRRLVRATPEA